MIEGIGTTWMGKDGSEKNIAEMSLGELRTMLCAKSGGSFAACDGCKSFATCPVGQRAARLRSEEARQAHHNAMQTEMEMFREACESGNARVYLMKTRMLNKGAAEELLTKLIRKYPGIAADFGGGRRITQRPMTARITPVAAQDGPVTADRAKVERKTEEAEKQQTEAISGAAKGAAIIRDKAREIARKAFEHGDPIAWLTENEGCEYKTARMRVSRWVKAYPDLAGDFVLIDMRGKARKKTAAPQPKDETEMENTERTETTEAAEAAEAKAPAENPGKDDEISLGDFLAEYAQAPEAEPEKAPEAENATETAAEPENETEDEPETNALKAELDRKYQALKAERMKLEERIRWLEKQQEALVTVAAMFGDWRQK